MKNRYITYLHKPDGGIEALTPVSADNDSRFLAYLSDYGMPCIPLIGEARFSRRYRDVPLHVHKGMVEITLCLRGNIRYECGGKEYRFRSGDIVVVGPGVPHRPSLFPKGLHRYRLLFKPPKRGERILGFTRNETDYLVRGIGSMGVRQFTDSTGDVRRGFRRLMKLLRVPPAPQDKRSCGEDVQGWHLRVKAAILDILLAVLDASKYASRNLPGVAIRQIADEMRDHPEREYELDVLAARLNMSVSSLLHRFKQVTGLPPHAFLTECRIEFAKACLQKSVPVEVVAHRSGYASSKQFSATFRRFTGVPPSRWGKG